MYAPFDVPRLLGRPLEVSITKESGLAGLLFLAQGKAGLKLDKTDPRLQSAFQYVQAQFEAGRQTAIEWEEIAPMLCAVPPSH